MRQFQLAPPREVLDRIEFIDTGIWSFGDTPWEEIHGFLRECGLTATQYGDLTAPDRRQTGPGGSDHAIETSPELLLSLSPGSRLKIYNRLALHRDNPTHTLPWVLPSEGDIEAAQLSPTLLSALRKLTYARGDQRCLTDAHLLAAFAEDETDLRRLKRLLNTMPALVVELTRASLDQRGQVEEYWSHDREQSAARLMRMLAESPDLDSLDISNFLPDRPQDLINEFPDTDVSRAANCFWTALNFFNPSPDRQFIPLPGETEHASDRAQRALGRDYEAVAPPYQLGDVLGLYAISDVHEEPRLFHAVSYIADDIVMSKNGIGEFVPTVLMKLDQVLNLYAWPVEIRVQGFRQKSRRPTSAPPPPPPAVAREVATVPGGFLQLRKVQLTAPEAVIEAHLDNFSTRQWWIGEESRGAFIGRLMGLELGASARDALFAPEFWQPAPDRTGFIVTPPPEALAQLSAEERRILFRELARWPENKPELWPLFFPRDADWDRFARAGIPAPFIRRVRELCYPCGDGHSLSDFSVLANEFPDRTMLRRFLRIQSTVSAVLPRLRLSAAMSISETLAYWTSNHRNPFAQPMLEALLASESEEEVELITIMPGSARRLSVNIEPEDISYNIQRASYLISANLSSLSHRFADHENLGQWFEVNFEPIGPPYRYGDILEFTHPRDQIISFACAYVGAELVFARDPVGLGLWRFMPAREILGRNPHFIGGSLEGLRYREESTYVLPAPPAND